MYWLIGVATNNHCGLALYAHIQNEETWVHKKQSFGAHHKGKCGKGVVDSNRWCEVVVIKIQGAWIMMSQGTPNHMYEVNTHLQSMPTTHGMGIAWKFM